VTVTGFRGFREFRSLGRPTSQTLVAGSVRKKRKNEKVDKHETSPFAAENKNAAVCVRRV